MKIKLIETGKVIGVDDSYGMRLYEQGKAELVPEKPVKAEKSEKAEAPKEEPKKKKE